MRTYKSVVKTVGGNEGSKCCHRTRLDTYGRGCSHDCSYCYAKSLLDFRGMWDPQDPAVGDIDTIRKAVDKLPKEVVRMGGMTDCFQPCEVTHRVTHKTLQMLNEKSVPYLIVTKSALVADYMDVLDKDLAHIQITVTTLDDDLAATYEKASKPSDRIAAIKVLQREGYDVQLRLSPFIPEYMDTGKLAEQGIDKVCVEFLRANGWIRRWFDTNYDEYIIKQDGYRHLPMERKIELLDRLHGFKELTVCEDEDKAWQYWHDHVNPNPDDCCNLRRYDNG